MCLYQVSTLLIILINLLKIYNFTESGEVASVSNIDKYMNNLQSSLMDTDNDDELSHVQNVSDIISNMNFDQF